MSDEILVPSHLRFNNLTGKPYGLWTVISFAGRAKKNLLWNCRCKCGTERVVRGSHLVSGASESCGCVTPGSSAAGLKRRTHGHTVGGKLPPEYYSWQAMLARCNKPKSKDYPRYGARGIKVCERWLDFAAFLEDMGKQPSPKHTIERKDNDGNYEPTNCRWATEREQANNRRSNRRLTYDGKTKTMVEWARDAGIPYDTFFARLKAGWSVGKAITTPVRQSKSK